MLLYFINRAGRQLRPGRRAELERAKRIMQEMVAAERARESGRAARASR
jgi:hypothetical protein